MHNIIDQRICIISSWMQISNAGILQVCAWVIIVWINYKKFTETHEQPVQVRVQALLKECI